LRIRIGRGFWGSRWGLGLLGTAVFLILVAVGIGTYYWISFGRMIDQRLAGHIQQTTARIYAAPMRIYTGEALTVNDLANHLQRAGYSELDVNGTPGRYVLHGREIEIRPSAESYFGGKTAWSWISAARIFKRFARWTRARRSIPRTSNRNC